MANFDPYYTWLGIPPEDQPADHYRLLGLKTLESNVDVISHASDKQMAHLRTLQAGKNAAASQQLLNEISAATSCLLDPAKKADYDRALREQQAAKTRQQAAAAAPQRALPVARPLAPAGVHKTPVAAMPSMPAAPKPTPSVNLGSAPQQKATSAAKSNNNLLLVILGGVGVAALAASILIVVIVMNNTQQPIAAVVPETSPDNAAGGSSLPVPPPPVPTPPPPPVVSTTQPTTTTPQPPTFPTPPVVTPPVQNPTPQPTPTPPVPGPVTPSPPPSAGSSGKYVLRFQPDSLIEFADTVPLVDFNQPFTIELLVRPEPEGLGMSGTPSPIFTADQTGLRAFSQPEFRGFYWFTGGGATRCLLTAPTGKEWLHLAVTHDEARIASAWTNGRLTERHAITGGGARSNSLFALGTRSPASRSFRGDIGGLRVSSKAHYRESFTPPTFFEKDDTTILLLDLSKPNPNQVDDLSGRGHHGKISKVEWVPGEPSITAESLALVTTSITPRTVPPSGTQPAPRDFLLRLAGDSSVTFENTENLLNVQKPFTIELIARFGPQQERQLGPSLFGNWVPILCRMMGTNEEPRLVWMLPGYPAASGKLLPHTGKEWQHVALTCDGETIAAWLNGKLTAQTNALPRSVPLPPPTKAPGPLVLGKLNTNPGGGPVVDIGGLRLSSNVRYRQTFQPPVRFTNDADTILLLDLTRPSTGKIEDLSGQGHAGILEKPQWLAGKPEYSGLENVSSTSTNTGTVPSNPQRPAYVLKDAVWNPATGSWYCLLSESMTFTEARKIAAANSATPVIIDSKEENEFVYRLSPKPTDIWLGLVKGSDGKLLTLDGKPAPFVNWNSGEGTLPGEKYVFMMWGGKHADSYPDNKKALVCLEWKHVSSSETSSASSNPTPDRSLGTFLSDTQPETIPVPATEALDKARAQIVEIFGTEAKQATKPEQKTALAQKMLSLARDTKSDPAAEYVLLDNSRKLLMAAGEVLLAMSSVARLTERFSDESWSIRTETLDSLGDATLLPPAREALTTECVKALDAALDAQKFELADQYSLLAVKVASKLKDVELRKQIGVRRTEMVKLKQEVTAYEGALTKLKETPDDAAANLLAGEFLCFQLHDWETGRPHLVKSGQNDLAQAAQADLTADEGDPAKKVAAADAWLKWAESLKSAADKDLATAAQGRAKLWYLSAQPNLTGLDKAKVDKRLSELASVAAVVDRKPKSTGKTTGGSSRTSSDRTPGLIGRLTVDNVDAGLLATYQLGYLVGNDEFPQLFDSLKIPLDPNRIPVGKRLKLEFLGLLNIPADGEYEIAHVGGSSSGGVHTLYLANQKLMEVGDDRTKNDLRRVKLTKGEYSLRWQLTGGHFGTAKIDIRNPSDSPADAPQPSVYFTKQLSGLARAPGVKSEINFGQPMP